MKESLRQPTFVAQSRVGSVALALCVACAPANSADSAGGTDARAGAQANGSGGSVSAPGGGAGTTSAPGGAGPADGSGGAGARAGGGAAQGAGSGASSAGASSGGHSAGGAISAGGGLSAGGRGGRSGESGGGGRAGAAGRGGSAGATGSGGDSAIVVPAGYKLVWHDEFDVDGKPNPANWKYESGFVRNEEEQWYQASNASVQGGLLVIEARKETVTNPNYTGSGDWKTTRRTASYTSASLLTSGLQSWQYGRFELRARIPTATGMWPAWWTLGVSGEWPSNGEIDIMEYYRGNVLANVACGTSTRWTAKWDSASKPISSFGSDWPSQFHVWRMDWDEQNIVLYLDDQQMNTTTLASMLNSDGTSPFKQKAYMLVNLALGGANGGDPAGTAFPQRYEIDYVRVFQKQ